MENTQDPRNDAPMTEAEDALGTKKGAWESQEGQESSGRSDTDQQRLEADEDDDSGEEQSEY